LQLILYKQRNKKIFDASRSLDYKKVNDDTLFLEYTKKDIGLVRTHYDINNRYKFSYENNEYIKKIFELINKNRNRPDMILTKQCGDCSPERHYWQDIQNMNSSSIEPTDIMTLFYSIKSLFYALNYKGVIYR